MNLHPTYKQGAAKGTDNPRIDKILQLINFYTKVINQFPVKAEYIPASRQINLSGMLQQVHSQGLKIENSQIFFQNSQAQMYIYMGTFPFETTVCLSHEFCQDSLIRIRYKKLSDSPKSGNKEGKAGGHKLNSEKKGKPIRSIGQVLEIVQQWKKIQIDSNGNKIHTLNQAALMIGVNKKTLEDYSYQIQCGSQFNFNFESNMEQPIGVLRGFVRNKKKQRDTINNVDNYWSIQPSSSDEDLKSD